MKHYFVSSVAFLTHKSALKKFCVAGVLCVLTLATRAQILNGSFENGFTGWNTTPGDFIIGGPSEPVGTDGYYSGDLGGDDITGAVLSQTINNFAGGGMYQLSYDSVCNADGNLSLVAVWNVIILADSQQVASQTISQQNVGQPTGSFGFVHRELTFTVAPSVQNITIEFADATPNGGVGVDAAFDSVAVTPVPEPGSMAITGLAVLAGLVMRRRIPTRK